VTAVRLTDPDSVVTVHYTRRDGKEAEPLTADAVLMACPSLQRIEFAPELPSQHTAAVERLVAESSPAYKCGLLFSERFWEQAEYGAVVAGTSWIGPSEINQVYFPQPCPGATAGFLLLYLRGNPMRQWMEHSLEDRIERALVAVEHLFGNMGAPVRRLFVEAIEQQWDDPGSGAYMLADGPMMVEALGPIGKVILSPVPRGWIDDALVDGDRAVRQTLAVLGLG
jgi:monoamine oxidase